MKQFTPYLVEVRGASPACTICTPPIQPRPGDSDRWGPPRKLVWGGTPGNAPSWILRCARARAQAPARTNARCAHRDPRAATAAASASPQASTPTSPGGGARPFSCRRATPAPVPPHHADRGIRRDRPPPTRKTVGRAARPRDGVAAAVGRADGGIGFRLWGSERGCGRSRGCPGPGLLSSIARQYG
jgi:hypothetical protein